MIWYKPTPVETTSNQAAVLPPGIVQVYEGKSATLNWDFNLTSTFFGAIIKFNDATIVNIASTGIAGSIRQNFQGRFSVSSDTRSVTLSITKVTVTDDGANGNFSCDVLTDAETWRRNIQVQVLGKL